MRELDALAFAEEEDGVIADDVAASEGVHADLGWIARARTPFAPVHPASVARGSHDLAEANRGAARRVDLGAVVRLYDLHVVSGTERRERLLDERREHVHPDAHVGLP